MYICLRQLTLDVPIINSDQHPGMLCMVCILTLRAYHAKMSSNTSKYCVSTLHLYIYHNLCIYLAVALCFYADLYKINVLFTENPSA